MVLVVVKLQQNRVVDQRALVITQPCLFDLTHGELRQITRRQDLRQGNSIGPT
ncbi:MAG: hypothetical protein NZ936_09210 [Alphaproteobacteria bacterium]|nr:hypothetical protein [Alphaproteobacteria bacterium]